MKIGLIGLGFMGVTHLKGLKNIPDVEIAAVASDVPERLSGDLSGVAGNLGGPGERFDFSRANKYADWREAVADPGIDAVDICLPTHLHAPAAKAALAAGKHVLVEKPMAIDGATADALVDQAKRAGRILMSAQVLRFFPAYVRLRELLATKSLGPVRSASFRRRCAAPGWAAWMADKKASGGGVFDLLIHDVDMMVHLFGPPAAVSSTGYENLAAQVDVIHSRFTLEDGQPVTISGGWHHAGFPFSMEFTVVAENGTVEYHSGQGDPVLYRPGKEPKVLDTAGMTDGYQAETEYFVDCCRAGASPALCPPAESSLAVKLALAMDAARAEQGKEISCRF